MTWTSGYAAPRLLLLWVLASFTALGLEYPDNVRLEAALKQLADSYPALVKTSELSHTPRNAPVLLVEVGALEQARRAQEPAMLAVAGIEGNDLAGSTILLEWVRQLTSEYTTNKAVRSLLDSRTLFVIPRLNPEGAAALQGKPAVEMATDLTPVDDDHDGLVDEDPPTDVNGDGLVTWMRVKDVEGEYILDPSDPRLLLKADRALGQVGSWKLFPESFDKDADENWGEDGPGGVNYNRNFPYGYKPFAPDAGLNPVSEPVTRALADFVVKHPNIGVVFTFGAADNLVQTPKAEAPKRPPTALQETDLPFYREFGKAWRERLGLSKELTGASLPGSFSDWIYFHRGRLSLAARPWSPVLQVELAKTKGQKPQDKGNPEKPTEQKSEDAADKSERGKDSERKAADADKRNEEERAFVKWLDQNAPSAFVPWKEFNHPDFPGKVVEIGGFAPGAKVNPPEPVLTELAKKEGDFLTNLAGKLPRIGVRSVKVKALGQGVYDVTIQVENTGYLPTSLAQGTLTREVLQTRVTVDLDAKDILTGSKRTMLGPIEGSGGMKEARYVVHTTNREIGLEIVSALGGTVRTKINLADRN